MSGINTAMFHKPILPQLYSLVQLLAGWLGEDEDLEAGAQIVRVIIAGNFSFHFIFGAVLNRCMLLQLIELQCIQ